MNSAQLVPDSSVSDLTLRLAVAAYLARFKGQSRVHTESDLRCYLVWCHDHDLRPLEAKRAHVELYLRWMQEVRRFQPSTVSRRLSVVAGFYRTCVIDSVLEHSPADYVRHPHVSVESPTLGLSHLQFEALLAAARDSHQPCDFALVTMLGLLGLRIFEASGADVTDLGEVRGHRVLTILGKGDKFATVPLPPAVGRAIDRATDNQTTGPILRNRRDARMSRHTATRRLRHLAHVAGFTSAGMHPTCSATPTSPPCSTQASTSATSRSQPATPTHAPPCATTEPARTSTDTPTASSPPVWHPAPSTGQRHERNAMPSMSAACAGVRYTEGSSAISAQALEEAGILFGD
jgi:integrase/recombinase XerD